VIRHYRVPPGQLVPALAGAALFLLVGLGGLTQPLHKVGAGGLIVAVLAVAAGCLAAALALTTQATLTPAGIRYRANLRSGTVPWASAASFRIGRARSWGNWSCVVVSVSGRGDVRLPITGSRAYVERAISEIEAYSAALTTTVPEG
jgi:hypothetical protein